LGEKDTVTPRSLFAADEEKAGARAILSLP